MVERCEAQQDVQHKAVELHISVSIKHLKGTKNHEDCTNIINLMDKNR